MQGIAQNEIPDSFLFDGSVTFQLGDANMDELQTFRDVWTRVLDEACLNTLQEINPINHEQARIKLRQIDKVSEDWGNIETAALKVFEAQTRSNPEQAALFKQYI